MKKSGYNTKQKNEIISFLKNHSGESFSARELIENEEISAGEATVYRTLAYLSKEGVLKKFNDGTTGISLYQIDGGENCHNHMHLICNGCGKIIHLDHSSTSSIEQSIALKQQFEVDCEATVIYGRCIACARRNLY